MSGFDNLAPDSNYLIDPVIVNPNLKVKIADDINGVSSFDIPLNPLDQSFGYHGV
jgi:hypothetical protein